MTSEKAVRRKLRKTLGTRTARRSGIKSSALRQKGALKPKPRALLNQKFRAEWELIHGGEEGTTTQA